MDAGTFDQLARTLSGRLTRRAGIAAAAAAALAVPAAAARRSAPHGGGHAGENSGKRRPRQQGPCGDGSNKANRCKKNGDCCTDLCDRASGNPEGRCRCVRAGKACKTDRNCCSGRICTGGKCARNKPAPPTPPAAKVPTGEACQPASICADAAASCAAYALGVMAGTYCLLPAAAQCEDDDQCVSSFCNGGTCAASCTVCASGCPEKTIGAAITAASADDVIGIAPGVYDEKSSLTKSLTLRRCGSAGVVSIASTTEQRTIFTLYNVNETLTLEDLELTGEGDSRRSLVYLQGNLTTRARLVANNVVFKDLTADTYGAVIAYNKADVELNGCDISGITGSGKGGAVTVLDYCTLTVTDSTFTGNTGSDSYGGGGIHAYDATVSIDGCTFTDNDALGYPGGGVYVEGGSLVLANSTFTGNKGETGAGLEVSSADFFSVTDCTFSGNTATNGGGGVKIDDTPGSLTRVKVTGNTVTGAGNAFEGGGGMMITGYANPHILTDCEISGNTGNTRGGGLHVYAGVPGVTSIVLAGTTSITGNSLTAGAAGAGSGISVLQDSGASQTVSITGSRPRVTGNVTPPAQCMRANGVWTSNPAYSEVVNCAFA